MIAVKAPCTVPPEGLDIPVVPDEPPEAPAAWGTVPDDILLLHDVQKQ